MKENQADILILCQIDKQALSESMVVLECEANVNGDKALKVLPWNTPLESRLMGAFLQVTKSDGEPLAYRGMMVKRAAPQEHDYLEIKPGEAHLSRLDLTRSYAFCAATEYTISYDGRQMVDEHHSITLQMESIRFKTPKEFASCHE